MEYTIQTFALCKKYEVRLVYCHDRCDGNAERDRQEEHPQKRGFYPAGERESATLMDDIRKYFEKDVFTEKKDVLEKAGRYHKDLCGEHGRLEK